MATDQTRILWVDLEMTGLEPKTDVIVEIATLITDSNLEIVAEGPELVIHQPEEALANMSQVVVDMHTRSGLIEQIRASKTTLAEAQAQTAAFVKEHLVPGKSPLAGNSVWKDKQFLEAYMPDVMSLLHYRIIDVSTIKELTRRWYPGLVPPNKGEKHRALEDIKESINELRHYRANVFVK